MLGNRLVVEAQIKKEMGEETPVKHECGFPFCIYSSINNKTGKMECFPPYYNNCHNCGCDCCGGQEQTAKNAADILKSENADEATQPPGAAA